MVFEKFFTRFASLEPRLKAHRRNGVLERVTEI